MTALRVDPGPAEVGAPVSVRVDVAVAIASPPWCGLEVDLGDGRVVRLRADKDSVPLEVAHRYSQPGEYTVRAEGRLFVDGVGTAWACSGAARTAHVSVVDTSAERERQRRAAEEARAVQAQQRDQAQRAAVEAEQAERARREAAALQARAERDRTQRDAEEKQVREREERLQAQARSLEALQAGQEALLAERAQSVANREAELARRARELDARSRPAPRARATGRIEARSDAARPHDSRGAIGMSGGTSGGANPTSSSGSSSPPPNPPSNSGPLIAPAAQRPAGPRGTLDAF